MHSIRPQNLCVYVIHYTKFENVVALRVKLHGPSRETRFALFAYQALQGEPIELKMSSYLGKFRFIMWSAILIFVYL